MRRWCVACVRGSGKPGARLRGISAIGGASGGALVVRAAGAASDAVPGECLGRHFRSSAVGGHQWVSNPQPQGFQPCA